MFGPMKDMAAQFQMMQRLMKDENFKAFIAHPDIQELFRDPEFRDVAKTRDFTKILAHPKFAAALRDPELSALMAKVDLKGILANSALS